MEIAPPAAHEVSTPTYGEGNEGERGMMTQWRRRRACVVVACALGSVPFTSHHAFLLLVVLLLGT